MNIKMKILSIIITAVILMNSSCSTLEGEDFQKNNSKNKWISSEWGYSITFPDTWKEIKEDNFNVMSPNVDVYCEKNEYTSTAIFAYSYHPSRSMDKAKETIIGNHINNTSDFKLLNDDIETIGNNNYRKILFKTGEYIHYYTIIFTDDMQLWISSMCKFIDYSEYEEGFEAIVNSFNIDSNFGAKRPNREFNRWESERWDYSVTFPRAWNRYIKIQPYESENADVFCNTWWGTETVIYTYIKPDNITLETVLEDVIEQYETNTRNFEILDNERSEYMTNSIYEKVFKFAPYNYEGTLINRYTGIYTNEVMLLISSIAKEENYLEDKDDFEQIIDTILKSINN